MKTVLELKFKYDKSTHDIVKMVAKIRDLLRSLRGGYKIYENQNTIEVTK